MRVASCCEPTEEAHGDKTRLIRDMRLAALAFVFPADVNRISRAVRDSYG